jgi:cell cycle checkpoint protein
MDSGRESLVQEFTQFLLRAGMSPALTLTPDPSFRPLSTTSASIPTIISPSTTTTKRLILLEDLPNTSHYPTKLALRSALLQYLASPRVTCPLVLIVSEALSRPGMGEEAESTAFDGGRGDSVDARNVCGIDVLQSPGCHQILLVLFLHLQSPARLINQKIQIQSYRSHYNEESTE